LFAKTITKTNNRNEVALKKRISLFAKTSLVVFFISVSLYIISEHSVAAADFLNSTVCYALRRIMASLTDFLPFSLFEVLLILLPLWIFLIIFFAVRAFKRGRALHFTSNLFAVVLLVLSEYIFCLGIAYNTTPLSKSLGLEKTEITEEKLASVMTSLRDEVNELSRSVFYLEDGSSAPAYGFREASEHIVSSFDDVFEDYSLGRSFSSHSKPIYFGNVMSYFRLTGIYTFYTGEANVNSAYPMYDMLFTSAHELSHQRGILRENEANFMAYLVLSDSDDEYLRYSAALSMYEYIASALYRTNKDRYFEIAAGLDEAPKGDILLSNAVTQKYGDTFLADVSNFLNDLFLKSNGTAGVITYGQVVNLTVAYFEQMK